MNDVDDGDGDGDDGLPVRLVLVPLQSLECLLFVRYCNRQIPLPPVHSRLLLSSSVVYV